MRIILILGLAAGASAQPPLQIHGSVIEPGTNHGIAGAEVTLTQQMHPERSGPYTKTISKITTDSLGGFDFAPSSFGDFSLSVRKEGYLAPLGNPLRSLPASQGQATLDAAHPAREMRLSLVQAGELKGRVADEDGKPLAKIKVGVLPAFYFQGERRTFLGHQAVTDDEGRFGVAGLPPGEYVATVVPQTLSNAKVLTDFSEANTKATDLDFETAYWPGGASLDQSAPVLVDSGGLADVGTLRPRRVPFYRLKGSVTAPKCSGRDKAQLFITSPSQRQTTTQELPCGADFLLRNLQPGSYRIELTQGDRGTRMSVLASVEVIDRNVEASFAPIPGADLEGRFVVPDGAGKPSFESLGVRPWTVEGIPFGDEIIEATPDKEGRFKLEDIQWTAQELRILGLPDPYYVSEIRYNGAAVPGKIIPLDSNSPAQSLEIVVDDRPASVAGSVAVDDKPVPQPYVILVRTPVSPENIFESIVSTNGDSDGKFRFAGLGAGEYKVAAVSLDDKAKLDEPHVLERLLSSAERVTVDRGSSQNLTLKLADPAH